MKVTNKSISRWENGNTMLDISMFSLLAEELDCTMLELLYGGRMIKEEPIDMITLKIIVGL